MGLYLFCLLSLECFCLGVNDEGEPFVGLGVIILQYLSQILRDRVRERERERRRFWRIV